MMGLHTRTSDFALDTIGHCFVCLTKSLRQSSLCSLHYLSRYLKIEMKKAFHDNENVSIPEHLLDQVERSTLKVSLCDQCATWNAKLSELYQQLEKIEVEAASYLELLHRQLLEANNSGRSDVFRKVEDYDSTDGLRGKLKLEITEAIRSETIKKCSSKLNKTQPKIKIQKLTKKEILSRTKRCRTSLPPSTKKNIGRWSICEPTLNLGTNLDSVKSEFLNENDTSSDIGNDYSGDFDHVGEQYDGSEQPDFSSPTQDYVDPEPAHNIRSSNYKQHVRKSDTGKLVCKLCSEEFASMTGFNIHYQKSHLNIRFQCQICNKIFTEKGGLTVHQRSVHFKQRVKCQSCSKSFSSKANRSHHIRLGKCSGRPPKVTYI